MRRSFFVVIGLLILVGCVCRPDPADTLAVPLHPQETNMWCWAASAQMSLDFLGNDVSQCTQANNRFGRTDCCNSPTPNACINGGWPEFGKYGFTSDITNNTALSWSDVRKQIFCRNAPVAFSWHWNGGGGHMMVLTGYQEVNGVSYVTINDPWPPNTGDQRVITYAAYVSGAGYTHWNDYYNIAEETDGGG